MEVNVINDRADIALELTTTGASSRAEPYDDQSCPLTSLPSSIIFEKPLEETKHPDLKNIPASAMSLKHPKKETVLSHLLLCCFSLCLWPHAYFLPILLYHLLCFGHIIFQLPNVIRLVLTFPFHFIFPTGSLRAWSVIGD